MKQCGTGMVREEEQPWHWGPHSSKQLANTQLWRSKHGAGQNWFQRQEGEQRSGIKHIEKTTYVSLGGNVLWKPMSKEKDKNI